MPDISKCGDTTCPSRMTCYRYRAKATPGRQSYFSPMRKEGAPICDDWLVIYGDNFHLIPEGDLE